MENRFSLTPQSTRKLSMAKILKDEMKQELSPFPVSSPYKKSFKQSDDANVPATERYYALKIEINESKYHSPKRNIKHAEIEINPYSNYKTNTDL